MFYDTTEEYQTELGKYAKNYLPILFNVYTSEENQGSEIHQVVIDTVRDFLKVTDQQVNLKNVTKWYYSDSLIILQINTKSNNIIKA